MLGLIDSDWSDVTGDLIAIAKNLGFRGIGAHLTVPAKTIGDDLAEQVRRCVADGSLELLQLWAPYPPIISADEAERRRGVAGATDIVRLAARMGVPTSGIRPTSHNRRGAWWPHPENHSMSSEDRLVRSICEVLEIAVPLGVGIVLEAHVTSTLDSPARIRRIIERTDPVSVRVNIDPVNFIRDLPTAFDPTSVVAELFDVLGDLCATVHVKDYVVEDRHIVHISETMPGAGLMDLDTVLMRTASLEGGGWAIVEHLSLNEIPVAKHYLSGRARALGIPVA